MPAISRDGAAGTGSLYKGSRKSVLNSDRCPLDTFRFATNLRLTVSEMLVNVKNLSARDCFREPRLSDVHKPATQGPFQPFGHFSQLPPF